MTLIKSISGIRGTIGGTTKDNLTPVDTVKFAAAYGTIIKEGKSKCKIVLGRDARLSGDMISGLVVNTLIGLGIDVIDLGLSTTPTVEMAVPELNADGGIILTASHNPKQWNALKLLNNKGEFISAEIGAKVLDLAEKEAFTFAEVDDLGKYSTDDTQMEKHVDAILNLPYVNADAIKSAGFRVVVDAVNSTGGIFIPYLLDRLGVDCVKLYCEPTGHFPHNPEPLPAHLTDLSNKIVEEKADFGITVDPDVDRLAMVCEDGSMFGEEYTLVAVADYVLSVKKGNTVSNLSSTRALSDVSAKHGVEYFASAVGEVNVVEKMKAVNAVIGGEGNGGVILPELHYGRDALVGIAIFLSLLVEKKMTCLELRNSYPNYEISKNKIQLQPGMDIDGILRSVEAKYKNEKVNTIDGVKIDFSEGWVHLRKSNTEPIIRVYSESTSLDRANELAQAIIDHVNQVVA